MKSKLKRIAALFAALMLTAAAAGCSGAKITLIDDVDTNPVYLNFFSLNEISESNVAKYWSERFTERYNKRVYINYEGASYYAGENMLYRELLVKRLESSSPDDLYIINAEDVLEFDKKGFWMDLSDMAFIENLSEAALYQSTYNGKVFSLPLSFTGYGFVWNVDILKRLGLTVPHGLAEFLNVCEKVKNSGILPYGANMGYALTVPAMGVGLSELYSKADVTQEINALNNGAPISNYMLKGYEFLAMMMERGYIDPEQAINTTPREGDYDMFLRGECAFICSTLGEFREKDVSFEWRQTGLPLLEDGCVSVYGANNRLCVNPDTKNLAAVREFIEMLGTPDALAVSANLDHAISAAKNGGAAEHRAEAQLAALLRTSSQIPNQDFALHFNTWESIRNAARTLCTGSTPLEACAVLDAKQIADLESYGDYPVRKV